MKNIKVKRLEDDNSVNVRIEHSTKMAATVDKLLKLDDGNFRKAISIAKKYRKANRSMAKFIDKEDLRIKIESNKSDSVIVNNLVDLRGCFFCAKM